MSEAVRQIVREIYSEVLFELAEETGQIEQVTEDFGQVVQLLKAEDDFALLLSSQTIKGQEKSEIIHRVFEGKVSDLTLNFLSVLAKRNRIGFLSGISDRYESIVDVYHKRHLIEVTVAKRPDTDQIQKLKAALSNAINGDVKLSVEVDPKIIGGIKIRKADKVIDNTVKTALKQAAGRIKGLEMKDV